MNMFFVNIMSQDAPFIVSMLYLSIKTMNDPYCFYYFLWLGLLSLIISVICDKEAQCGLVLALIETHIHSFIYLLRSLLGLTA